MNKKAFGIWFLFSGYLYFAYHLLVIPAILDLSLLGVVLAAAGAVILVLAAPPGYRRSLVVYALLFLLADKAFSNLGAGWKGFWYAAGFVPVILMLLALGKWYGRLSGGALAALVLSGVCTVLLLPRAEVPLLNNFIPQWKSGPLYAGKVFDYFPLAVKDIDGDGRAEIITLGNISEVEKPKPSANLVAEPLYLYVFKWDGREMKRVQPTPGTADTLLAQLTEDYPGFPYYYRDSRNRLVPLVQRQELAEGMLQFGTAPYRALALDMKNLAVRLQRTGGVLDSAGILPHSKSIRDVKIKDGQVTGVWKGRPFKYATGATKIIDGITLPGGREGLVLLGRDLELLSHNAQGQVYVSHRVTREMLKNIASTEFLVADVDGDGTGEILVSSSYSRILKPLANGRWDIFWTASDPSFRFEDMAPLGAEPKPELLTLDKGMLGSNPLRYLAGYEYSRYGLKRQWKSFVSLINVRAGDIDGDGKNELVAAGYRSPQIYVLKRHNLPVTGLLLGVTVLLAAYGAVRRIRHVE